MFQHKAIENLENPVYYDGNMRIMMDLSIKKKEFDEAIRDLREAQNFYLGHDDWVKGLSKKKKELVFNNDNLPFMRLPYDNTTFWLERSYVPKREGINCIRGCDAIFCRYIHLDAFDKHWHVWPIADIVNFDKPQSERIYPYNLSQNNLSDMCKEVDMQRIDSKTRGYSLSILDLVLNILSCRNITYETVNPPNKLNKKRKRKGKEKIASYHVLNIAPMSPKKQFKSGVTDTGEMKRVHLCRGHFKTYTEDAPLFGRFTGRFWWQPQVRGQDKSGIVHKDYQVEV